MSSIITDSAHSVGLRVTGNGGVVSIEGTQSNSFTGNAEVSGARNLLVLYKREGAIAMRGNILIKDSGMVRFQENNQITRNTRVVLKNNGILQTLSEANSDISNTFNHLVVENSGVLNFHHEQGVSECSKYYIKIDDILINQGGHLKVEGWKAGRDFFLVRKTKEGNGISTGLADALTKLSFAGYDRNNIHLEDFDAEYWSISAAPEPATCGAILAAAGLGLRAWQRRKRSQRAGT